MQRGQVPGWQRLLAAVVIVVGVALANPVGHALVRPQTAGGPAAPVVVPVFFTVLLLVALAMALIGPTMAHVAHPLTWPEWLAAIAAGLTFALSGLALYWIGVGRPEVEPVLGVGLIHATAWWYVVRYTRYQGQRDGDQASAQP